MPVAIFIEIFREEEGDMMNIRSASNACDRLYTYIKSLEESDTSFYKSSRALLQGMNSKFTEMAESVSYTLGHSEVESKYELCSEDVVEQIGQIEEYVDSIVAGHKHMYRSSTDNLKKLREGCQRITDKISYLLGETTQNSKMESDILDIKEMLIQLMSGGQSIPNSQHVMEITKTVEQSVPEVIETVEAEPSKSETSRSEFVNDKRLYMKLYRDAFQKIKASSSGCCKLDNCTQLISDWFETRFNTPDPQFFYDISNIPKYLIAIVIQYGQAIADNKDKEYEDSFRKWLESVRVGGSKYALPYDTYQIIHKSQNTLVSTHSLLLWDALCSTTFKPVLQMPSGYSKPELDSMTDWVSQYSPSSLLDYEDFHKNPDILYAYDIVKKYDDYSFGKEGDVDADN